VNTPQETQLADDLHRLAADQPFPPDLDDIERRGRQRRRRGYAIRGLAGLAGLSVAATGGLVVSAHTGPGGATAARPRATAASTSATPGSTRPAETVAYVRQQIAAAFSPGNYLIESRQNTSGSASSGGDGTAMITIWTDPRTGNTMLLQGTRASKVTYWEHDYFDQHKVLHWDQTQVNYGPRTWWTYNEHASGPIQGPVPAGPVGGNAASPQSIEQLLQHGAKIVGHPYVDGRRTVELSVSYGSSGGVKLWADTATYQVVRMVKDFPSALNAPPIVANYTWTPRSAALAKLINQPQIPAGFRQVPVGS
jgi:hypothetical protein